MRSSRRCWRQAQEVVEDRAPNLQAVHWQRTKYESEKPPGSTRAPLLPPLGQERTGICKGEAFSEPRSDGDSNAKIATIFEYRQKAVSLPSHLNPARSSSRNAQSTLSESKAGRGGGENLEPFIGNQGCGYRLRPACGDGRSPDEPPEEYGGHAFGGHP